MRGAWLQVGLALGVALGGIVSCSPEKRHEVLTFLFDGVPSPGEVPVEKTVSPQFMRDRDPRPAAKPAGFFHKPYEEEKCGGCHPRQQSFSLGEVVPRDLCTTRCHAHEAFLKGLRDSRYVHGPVAVERCLFCHDPHESQYRGILFAEPTQLCYRCHDRSDVEATPIHQPARVCTDCHDPHGGNQRYFVKAVVPRPSDSKDSPVSQEGAPSHERP